MSRLTRKEMKRDEVLETANRVFDYFSSHVQGLLAGFAALVVVALAIAAVVIYMGQRKTRANEELAEAIKVINAEIVSEDADPDDRLTPTFASREMRDARAEELLEQVAAEFGRLPAGRIARVYLGRLAAQRGDLEGARQAWTEFLDAEPRNMLAAGVRLNLIALDRASGRGEEVVGELREMLATGAEGLPEVVLLDELATTLDELGRGEEALDVYQRILDEHPASPHAIRARQKLGPV